MYQIQQLKLFLGVTGLCMVYNCTANLYYFKRNMQVKCS
jgi:hypothetical protein